MKDNDSSVVKQVLYKSHNTAWHILNPIFGVLDRYGITSPDHVYRNSYYEKRRYDPKRSDAKNVSELLDNMFEPQNIIDFGCAIGHYLEPFYANGKSIKGVEGNQSALRYAVIPREHIEIFDLRNLYETDKDYDLALCFEVAEHLSSAYADTLVASLVNAADVVVFTAAPPGQGGQHHVNEQPRSYWIQKFEHHGFEYSETDVDIIRDSIELESENHIRNNLFVFKKTHYNAEQETE